MSIKGAGIQLLLLLFLILAGGGSAAAQTPTRPPDPARAPALTSAAEFKAPDDIDFRTASIMSEGVRLHAELFSPKALAGKPLPTIIQAHGWGGVAAHLRRDAIDMARGGYLVLTFDYRGWGESDARLVLVKPSPVKPISGQNQKFTAEVMEQREYVDPLEQVTDWFNVIHWAAGVPAMATLSPSKFSTAEPAYVPVAAVLVPLTNPKVDPAVPPVTLTAEAAEESADVSTNRPVVPSKTTDTVRPAACSAASALILA